MNLQTNQRTRMKRKLNTKMKKKEKEKGKNEKVLFYQLLMGWGGGCSRLTLLGGRGFESRAARESIFAVLNTEREN